MQVAHPPGPVLGPRPWVFLAGSIDMGRAPDWQSEVAAMWSDREGTLLNPRRLEWDASWRQSIEEPAFRGQVEWELDGLERADLVLLFLARESQAPISLLEMGLVARSGRLRVGGEPGFWRRGNVVVVSNRVWVPLHEDLAGLVSAAQERL